MRPRSGTVGFDLVVLRGGVLGVWMPMTPVDGRRSAAGARCTEAPQLPPPPPPPPPLDPALPPELGAEELSITSACGRGWAGRTPAPRSPRENCRSARSSSARSTSWGRPCCRPCRARRRSPEPRAPAPRVVPVARAQVVERDAVAAEVAAHGLDVLEGLGELVAGLAHHAMRSPLPATRRRNARSVAKSTASAVESWPAPNESTVSFAALTIAAPRPASRSLVRAGRSRGARQRARRGSSGWDLACTRRGRRSHQRNARCSRSSPTGGAARAGFLRARRCDVRIRGPAPAGRRLGEEAAQVVVHRRVERAQALGGRARPGRARVVAMRRGARARTPPRTHRSPRRRSA